MVLVVSTSPFPAWPDVHGPPYRRALAFLGSGLQRLLSQRGQSAPRAVRVTDGIASLQGATAPVAPMLSLGRASGGKPSAAIGPALIDKPTTGGNSIDMAPLPLAHVPANPEQRWAGTAAAT
jgi:hypothetical protein